MIDSKGYIMSHYVYVTTCLINGKKYIGQRSTTLLTKSDMVKDKYLGSGTLLLKAIKKYGKSSFVKDVIEVCEKQQDTDYMEITMIRECNATKSDEYYNIAHGGQYSRSDKHADKMSEIMTALYNSPQYRDKRGWLTKDQKKSNVLLINSPGHQQWIIHKLLWVKNIKEKEEKLTIAQSNGFNTYTAYVSSMHHKGGKPKGFKAKGYCKYTNEEFNTLVKNSYGSNTNAARVLDIHRSTVLNMCRGWQTIKGVRVQRDVKDSFYELLASHHDLKKS
jgi:group I intron endonuclease